MTNAAMKARIAQLEALLVQRASERNKLRLKVSPKGGVSVQGVNSKWPVTLYADQWERIAVQLFGLTVEQFKATVIGQFIEANRAALSFKNAETEAPEAPAAE